MLLNERYKLEDSLFSNTLGELYRARDMHPSSKTTSFVSRVLVHRLPIGLIPAQNIAKLSTELIRRSRRVPKAIDLLEVLEVGWSAQRAFVVMRAPSSWTYNAIPALDNQPTSLHLKASALIQSLMEQQLTQGGLDPAFFLVSPDGTLHLLSSALSNDLQNLQDDPQTLIQPNLEAQNYEKPVKLTILWLALAVLATVAALGGGYYQWQGQPSKSLAQTPINSQSNQINPRANTQPPDKPASINVLASDGQQIVTTETRQTIVPSPTLAAQTATSNLIGSPKIALTPFANTDFHEQLKQIQERIDNGRLQSALYYLNLAQRRYPDRPEVTALATKIVEHYYQQLEGQSPRAKEATLSITANIIREFKLDQLNAKQVRLAHDN